MKKVYFTEAEAEQVQKMVDGGFSRGDIARALGRSVDSVDGFLRRNGLQTCEKRADGTKTTVSENEKGERTISSMLVLSNGEKLTAELAMEMHGLDPKEWKVVSFTSNSWEMNASDGESKTNNQFKITVRPINKGEISFGDIDEYLKNKDFSIPRKPLRPFVYNDSKDFLEICYADPHIGLLSWHEETGADYDLDIVEEQFSACIADVINRAKCRPLKRIVFATLGDILHIDNDKSTTTAGTFQDSDGRVAKIFNRAVDMMVNCIDSLLELGVPIEYKYVAGNHDRNTGYFLAKLLEMAYSKEKNITFDISPNPQKAARYGNALIGWCHGDMPQKNLGEWLQKTYRQEFGNSKFAEVHCGHLHSDSVKENCGVLVKHLPAICESSAWEHQQGYSSSRGIMCFLWNEEFGLTETWYRYF